MDAREEAVRSVRDAGDADGMVSHALERLQHAKPREPNPKFSARGLTITGLTMLALFLALQMLIVPSIAEFFAWTDAPMPTPLIATMDLGRAMQQAWPAVMVAYAFLAWMLLRRPTRAAGAVLIAICAVLLAGLVLVLLMPAQALQQRAR